MIGLFDSLGVSLAFAGVVILAAGLFLTPMRGVILNSLRPRREEEIPLPSAPMQPPAPAQPVMAAPAVTARPAMPADVSVRHGTTAEALDAAREQEALFARALVTAQRTAEDLVRKAKAEAQDIIDKAQRAANEIVVAGRQNAAEVMQKATQEAEMIVTAANENATARLALLQAEVERLVVEAHQVFQGAQQSVQHNVASLKSRLELHTAEPIAWPHDGDREPASPGSGGQTAARDGSGITWLRPPLKDGRPTVGVGADGTTGERGSGRMP
jgi:hypothetical protein